MHVEAGEDGAFSVTRTLPKNFNKPRDSRSTATKKNKNFRRSAARLGKEVHTIRPDLKVWSAQTTRQWVCCFMCDLRVSTCTVSTARSILLKDQN